jgi:hypothetical protein
MSSVYRGGGSDKNSTFLSDLHPNLAKPWFSCEGSPVHVSHKIEEENPKISH